MGCEYDFCVKPKKNLENWKGRFFRVGRNLKLFESWFRLEELMMNVLRSNESNAQFFAVDFFLSLHIFEINHARNTNDSAQKVVALSCRRFFLKRFSSEKRETPSACHMLGRLSNLESPTHHLADSKSQSNKLRSSSHLSFLGNRVDVWQKRLVHLLPCHYCTRFVFFFHVALQRLRESRRVLDSCKATVSSADAPPTVRAMRWYSPSLGS